MSETLTSVYSNYYTVFYNETSFGDYQITINRLFNKSNEDVIIISSAYQSLHNKVISLEVDNVHSIYSEQQGVPLEVANKVAALDSSRKAVSLLTAASKRIGSVVGSGGESGAARSVSEVTLNQRDNLMMEINKLYKSIADGKPVDAEKVKQLADKFSLLNKEIIDSIPISQSLTEEQKVKVADVKARLAVWANNIDDIMFQISKELDGVSDNNQLSYLSIIRWGSELAEAIYGFSDAVKHFASDTDIFDADGNLQVPGDRSVILREQQAPKNTMFKIGAIAAITGTYAQIGMLLFSAKLSGSFQMVSGMSYSALLSAVFEYSKHSTNYLSRCFDDEFMSPELTSFIEELNIPSEFKAKIKEDYPRFVKIRYSNSTIFGNDALNQAIKARLFNPNYREIVNNDAQADIYSEMVGQVNNHNKKWAKIQYILKKHLQNEDGTYKYGLTEEKAKRVAFSLAVEDRDFSTYGVMMEVVSRAGVTTGQGIRFSRSIGLKGGEYAVMNSMLRLMEGNFSKEQIKMFKKLLITNFNQFDMLTMMNKSSREEILTWLISSYNAQNSELNISDVQRDALLSTCNKNLKEELSKELLHASQNLGVGIPNMDSAKASWLIDNLLLELDYENAMVDIQEIGNKISAGMKLDAEDTEAFKTGFIAFGLSEENAAKLLTDLSSDEHIEDKALYLAGVDSMIAKPDNDSDSAVRLIENAELLSIFERSDHKFHLEGNIREIAGELFRRAKRDGLASVKDHALLVAVKRNFSIEEDEKALDKLALYITSVGSASDYREYVRIALAEDIFGADNSKRYTLEEVDRISQLLADVIAREVGMLQYDFYNDRRKLITEALNNGATLEQAIKQVNIGLTDNIQRRVKEILTTHASEYSIAKDDVISKQSFFHVLRDIKKNAKSGNNFGFKPLIFFKEAVFDRKGVKGLEVTDKKVLKNISKLIQEYSKDNKDKVFILGNNIYLAEELKVSNKADKSLLLELAKLGVDLSTINTSENIAKVDKLTLSLAKAVSGSLIALNNGNYIKSSESNAPERLAEQIMYNIYVNTKLLVGDDSENNQFPEFSTAIGLVKEVEESFNRIKNESFEALHSMDGTKGKASEADKAYTEWLQGVVVDASLEHINDFLTETDHYRRGHYITTRKRNVESTKLLNKLNTNAGNVSALTPDEKEVINAVRGIQTNNKEIKKIETELGTEVSKSINKLIGNAIGDDVNGEMFAYNQIPAQVLAIFTGESGELTFDALNKLNTRGYSKVQRYMIAEAGAYSDGVLEFRINALLCSLAKDSSFVAADSDGKKTKLKEIISSLEATIKDLKEGDVHVKTFLEKVLARLNKELTDGPEGISRYKDYISNFEKNVNTLVALKEKDAVLREEVFDTVPALIFEENETEEAFDLTFNYRLKLTDMLVENLRFDNTGEYPVLGAQAIKDASSKTAVDYLVQQTGLYGAAKKQSGFFKELGSVLKTYQDDASTPLEQTQELDRYADDNGMPFLFDRAGEPIGWRKSKAGNTNNVMLGQTHRQRLANKIHLIMDSFAMEDTSFSRRFNPRLLNELENKLVKKIKLTIDGSSDRDIKYKKGMMPDQITAFIVKSLNENDPANFSAKAIRDSLIASWELPADVHWDKSEASMGAILDEYILKIAVSYFGALQVEEFAIDKLKFHLERKQAGEVNDLGAIISPELNSLFVVNPEYIVVLRNYIEGKVNDLPQEIADCISQKERSIIDNYRNGITSDKLSKVRDNGKLKLNSQLKSLVSATDALYSNDNFMGEWWTWSAQLQDWNNSSSSATTPGAIATAVVRDVQTKAGFFTPLQELITHERRSYLEVVMLMASSGEYPETIIDHGRPIPFRSEIIKIAKWLDFLSDSGIPVNIDSMFELLKIITEMGEDADASTAFAQLQKLYPQLTEEHKNRFSVLVGSAKTKVNYADRRKYPDTAAHKAKAEFIGNFDADNLTFANYVRTTGAIGIRWAFRNIKSVEATLRYSVNSSSAELKAKVEELIRKINNQANNIKYDQREVESVLVDLQTLYLDIKAENPTAAEHMLSVVSEQIVMLPKRWWVALVQFGQNFEGLENRLIRGQQMTDETNSKGMKQKTIAGCFNYSHYNSIQQISRFEQIAIEEENTDHWVRDYMLPIMQKLFNKDQDMYKLLWNTTTHGQVDHESMLYNSDGTKKYNDMLGFGTLIRKGLLLPHRLSARLRMQTGSSNFYQGIRGLQVLTALSIMSVTFLAGGWVAGLTALALALATSFVFKNLSSMLSAGSLRLMKNFLIDHPMIALAIGVILLGVVVTYPSILLSYIQDMAPNLIGNNLNYVALFASLQGFLMPGQGAIADLVNPYGKLNNNDAFSRSELLKKLGGDRLKAAPAWRVLESYDIGARAGNLVIDIERDREAIQGKLSAIGLSNPDIEKVIDLVSNKYKKSSLSKTRTALSQMDINAGGGFQSFLNGQKTYVKENRGVVNQTHSGIRLQGNKFFQEEEIYNEASIVEDFSSSYYAYAKGMSIDYYENTVGVNAANWWMYPFGTQRIRWWGGMGEQEPFMHAMFQNNGTKLDTANWYKLWCGSAGPLSAGLGRMLRINSSLFIGSLALSTIIPAAAGFVITPLVFSSVAFGGAHILLGLGLAHISYMLTLGMLRASKILKGSTNSENTMLFGTVQGPGLTLMYPESIVRKFNQRTGFNQTFNPHRPMMVQPDHWTLNGAAMSANMELAKAWSLIVAGIAGGLAINPALSLLVPVAVWSLINKTNVSVGLTMNHAFAREYDADYFKTSDKQRIMMQKRFDRNYNDIMDVNERILENGRPPVLGSDMSILRNAHRMFRSEF